MKETFQVRDFSGLKREIRTRIIESGAVAVGFAKVGETECADQKFFSDWLCRGWNADMDYLVRHKSLRAHPRNVMENSATVISCAFSFKPVKKRGVGLPCISEYAFGDDYHDVIRKRLGEAVEYLKNKFGGDWRICVDTAPLPERYWAVKSGIGYRGKNGSVIIDGYGSECFLAEVLTSLPVAPDARLERDCGGCGVCVKACPTGALGDDGSVNCRKCISYLTIEHRGDWYEEGIEAMSTSAGQNTLYGCDICQRVCHHNKIAKVTTIPEFMIREKIVSLDARHVAVMTQQEFSQMFKGSAIKRARFDGLRRNALNVLKSLSNKEQSGRQD